MPRTPTPEPTPKLRRSWARSNRAVPTRIIRPLNDFIHLEIASGILLAIATIAALVWANVDIASYDSLWNTTVTVRIGDWGHTETMRYVVNDGLMVLFFFVIGLEVKRELVTGELADRRVAMLPIFAAIGGMVVPAAVFLMITMGSSVEEITRGWGIPMATDIAFALGVLALLGSRVPAALKVLLLGIAVVDDIGAITVIALFYSEGVDVAWLLTAVATFAVIYALRRLQVRSIFPYVVLGLFAWLATFESGVHATIAGVVLGLLTPARPFQSGDAVSVAARRIADETADVDEDPDKDASEWRWLSWLSREAISPVEQLEHALHPWTSWVVLPLFALANVGIVFDPSTARAAFEDPLGVAVFTGLVVGKPIGILLGAALVVRLGWSVLPDGVNWRDITGIGALAGIGFTMSLFVTTLAFEDRALEQASTLAVLVASVTAGCVGALVLTVGRRRGGRSRSR